MNEAAAFWRELRARSGARIGLARAGASLATAPLLEFRLAHARARDAVYASLDAGTLAAALPGPVLRVASRAGGRQTYLMRPDLGRRLDPGGAECLARHRGACDLAVLLGDGLSAQALQAHAPPLLGALLPALTAEGWRIAPLVLATGARVALGDEVAQALGAGAVLVLIGERPGLSAPDSLGAYLTWAPAAATTDADRNCVSNIRAEGLAPDQAAWRLHQLMTRMRRLRLTGVGLKDESGAARVLAPPPA